MSGPSHNKTWPRRTKCKEGNLAFFYDHYGYDKYDVVVQMDADHVPEPGYLEEMIKPFSDPEVGYVSAPSICDANADESFWARGRLYLESFLHGALQAGFYAPLCIGSHYAVRTKALKEIGGLGPELAEDHSTSLIFNSNGWRGVFMGGWQTPAATNEMDYITIASEGNALDFGNLNTAVGFNAACSSSTRGISMGGYPAVKDIQYIEIGTLGAALDFGDLGSILESNGGLASPTRGISAAGMSPNATSFIEVITISSKGAKKGRNSRYLHTPLRSRGSHDPARASNCFFSCATP